MRQTFFAAIILVGAILADGCQNKTTVEGNQPEANKPVTATSPAVGGLATVMIVSPDGVNLVASFFDAGKPNSPALLLLHQWESDRHSYDDFAKRMQTKGFSVLAIDGRGFGESTKKTDGTTVTAGRTDADVKAMLGDVSAAFDFLSKQKNVDSAKIGIVGASYGSSLAIIYAADHPSVTAVALLSPGLNYFGNMPTSPAVTKYGKRQLYLIAGQEDKESFEAVKRLDPFDGNKVRYEQTIHPVAAHGTALLKEGADGELDDFFSRHLNLSE